MPLAILRTNLTKSQIPTDFMKTYSDTLVKTLQCEPKVGMVSQHIGEDRVILLFG